MSAIPNHVQQTKVTQITPETDRQYKSARTLAELFRVLGWIVLILGVAVALFPLMGVVGGATASGVLSLAALAILPGLAIALAGLFLLAGCELIIAVCDTADYSRGTYQVLARRAARKA